MFLLTLFHCLSIQETLIDILDYDVRCHVLRLSQFLGAIIIEIQLINCILHVSIGVLRNILHVLDLVKAHVTGGTHNTLEVILRIDNPQRGFVGFCNWHQVVIVACSFVDSLIVEKLLLILSFDIGFISVFRNWRLHLFSLLFGCSDLAFLDSLILKSREGLVYFWRGRHLLNRSLFHLARGLARALICWGCLSFFSLFKSFNIVI